MLRSPSPRPSPSGRGRALLICGPKCLLNKLLLFLLVPAKRTGSRGRGCWPGDPGKGESFEKPVTELDPQIGPCSHIDRLLLHPKNLRSIAEWGQGSLQWLGREWIKLLQANNGDVIGPRF